MKNKKLNKISFPKCNTLGGNGKWNPSTHIHASHDPNIVEEVSANTKAGDEHTSQLIKRHRPGLLNSFTGMASEKPKPALFENRVAFSVSEAAFLLGVSNRTVERLVRKGELRIRRVGRRILIPKDELEAWLNRKE